MALVRRAINILRKGGFGSFRKKLADYAVGRTLALFAPGADPRNANWHRYISELDRRVEYMKATPWKLEIASTSVCNLQCIMCTHIFAEKSEGRHFKGDLVQKLAGFIRGAGQFQLMGWGEPLLSPAFWKIMDIIREQPSRKPAFMEISSNGAAMTPHIAKKILASPLDRISFSLDACTPETYRKIRGADFAKTIANIRFLADRKKELGGTAPEIMLNMTLMAENIAELPGFVSLAHELGADSIQFWPLHDYGEIRPDSWNVERDGWHFNYREQMLGKESAEAANANAIIAKACEKAAQLGLRIVWPMDARVVITAAPTAAKPVTPKQPKPAAKPVTQEASAGTPQKKEAMQASSGSGPKEKEPAQVDRPKADTPGCVAPWEWMLVDIDGNVRPCCYIRKAFGNLHRNSPREIWNGEDYRELRRFLAKGELPPQCRDAACKYSRGSRFYTDAAKG